MKTTSQSCQLSRLHQRLSPPRPSLCVFNIKSIRTSSVSTLCKLWNAHNLDPDTIKCSLLGDPASRFIECRGCENDYIKFSLTELLDRENETTDNNKNDRGKDPQQWICKVVFFWLIFQRWSTYTQKIFQGVQSTLHGYIEAKLRFANGCKQKTWK